jgi:hypothetical protein
MSRARWWLWSRGVFARGVLALIVYGLLGVAASPARAGIMAGFLQANKNMTGFAANDYHVTLKNTMANQLLQTVGQPMPFLGATQMGTDLLLKWDAGGMAAKMVPNNMSGAFGAVFSNPKGNGIKVARSFWTDVNLGRLGGAPSPGFVVFGNKTDPIYEISNGLEDVDAVSFGVNITSMLVNVPEIPFSSLDPGAPSGTVPTGQGFILNPGDVMDFTIANIDPFNFLYVFGQIFDPTSREVIGTFIHLEQFGPAPEPATLGLLIVAGIPLLALRSWHGRRVRRQA